MMTNSMVGLADAIEALRRELLIAAAVGKDEPLRFKLEPVELAMEVAVTKDAQGKIGWQVIEASGGLEKVATQTLTVRLTPMWKKEDGTPTTDFSIASTEVKRNINDLGIGPQNK